MGQVGESSRPLLPGCSGQAVCATQGSLCKQLPSGAGGTLCPPQVVRRTPAGECSPLPDSSKPRPHL